MRLQNTQKAPLINVETINKNYFMSNKPREKLLLLAFFRYASCPLCNLRVHELVKNYHELQKNFEIVAVFQSPKEKIMQYVTKQNIPFEIIADPEKKLYKLYGIESSWLGFFKAWTLTISRVFDATIKHRFWPGSVENELNRIPADFIIDKDNIILEAYYGQDIGDHLPLERLFEIGRLNEARGEDTQSHH